MNPPESTSDADDLVAAVHHQLLESGDPRPIAEAVRGRAPLLTGAEREEVVRRVDARLRGLGPIEPLLHRDDVSEVMVNGPGPVWIERAGAIEPAGIEISAAELDVLVERIVAPIGRMVDPRRPWVDGRLADGSRVHIIGPPIAPDGPVLTIRRFVLRRQTLDAFAPPEVVDVLRAAAVAGRSLLVSGGTGAGKTTLLNALAAAVPRELRVVTVEEAAELQLAHPHVVRLEGRPPGVEGAGEVSLRELVRNALRMRPDRLVVGEVRGAEAIELVQALNTGHAGCMATIHANSPVDALDRLSTLVLSAGTGLPLDAVERQIASALDLVVQVARTGGARRVVVDVAAVTGPGRARSLIAARDQDREPKQAPQ